MGVASNFLSSCTQRACVMVELKDDVHVSQLLTVGELV